MVCEERTRLLKESRARFLAYLHAADDLHRTSTLDKGYGPKLVDTKRAEEALGKALIRLDDHLVQHCCR
jgi:hypothetical protein